MRVFDPLILQGYDLIWIVPSICIISTNNVILLKNNTSTNLFLIWQKFCAMNFTKIYKVHGADISLIMSMNLRQSNQSSSIIISILVTLLFFHNVNTPCFLIMVRQLFFHNVNQIMVIKHTFWKLIINKRIIQSSMGLKNFWIGLNFLLHFFTFQYLYYDYNLGLL